MEKLIWTWYTSSNWNVLHHSKITWHLLQLLLVWSAKHLLRRSFCLLLLILFHPLDPRLQSHGVRSNPLEPNWIRLAGTKVGWDTIHKWTHKKSYESNDPEWATLIFFKNLVLKSMLPCPRDTLTFPWRMPWRLKWKRTSCFEINSQTLRCGVLNVALPQGYIDLKTPKKKINLPRPGPFELVSFALWLLGKLMAQNPDPWSLQKSM